MVVRALDGHAERDIQYIYYRVGSVRNEITLKRDINSYSMQVYTDKLLGQKI